LCPKASTVHCPEQVPFDLVGRRTLRSCPNQPLLSFDRILLHADDLEFHSSLPEHTRASLLTTLTLVSTLLQVVGKEALFCFPFDSA
jgi:hypothetical protein